MHEILLKICRVEDLDSSKMLVWQGVNFLGMHLLSEKDFSKVDNYKSINFYLQNNLKFYGSVLVTRIKETELIDSIVSVSLFKYIQIHNNLSLNDIFKLRNYCTINELKLILVYDPKFDIPIKEYQKYSDILLIDHIKGGTGRTVNIKTFVGNHKFNKSLIAGGVNNLNIIDILNEFNPLGFDVQSYCETNNSLKDFKNVDILNSLLSPNNPRINIQKGIPILSISLTDLDLDYFDKKISPIYSDIDCFHIDHSTGYFNHNYKRNSKKIVKILDEKAKSKPYDLHIFANEDEVVNIIDDYLNINFRLHIVYIHLEKIPIEFEINIKKIQSVCNMRRIKLGIAIQVGEIMPSQIEKLFNSLKLCGICEISIVGFSVNKDIDTYKMLMSPLLEEIKKINNKNNNYFSLALDRDTTPEKYEFSSDYGVSKVFSGKSIIDANDSKTVIVRFKKLLNKNDE